MTFIEAFRQRLDASAAAAAVAPQAILDALDATLVDQHDFHRLFDARLIRVRRQLGLPITQPTSLNNVPREQETAFREAYVNTAREIGQLFLQHGRLADAWAYFRTIGEPEPVREAIEQIPIPPESTAEFDEIMNLALYEGAHVVRGLQFLLKTHGTCNTITAMGQLMQQMSQEERRRAAAMMVAHLYGDLQYSVRRDVESREPLAGREQTLQELLSGRDWLFENGNYHIDVSHLHATVGFARHLRQEDPELQQAIDLCLYGSRLDAPLRYPADVPFDDYYTGNLQFLQALAGQDQDAALAWFSQRLQQEPDVADQKLIAFVLMDLAQRVGRIREVLPQVAPFLGRLEDPQGFSFAAACLQAGCGDLLQSTAEANDDVLALATALLAQQSPAAGS